MPMKGVTGVVIAILLAYLCVVQTAHVALMWQAVEFAQEQYADSDN